MEHYGVPEKDASANAEQPMIPEELGESPAETQEETFFDRVTSFRKEGESLNHFAKRTKIPFATLKLWKNGASPCLCTVIIVAEKLQAEIVWLAFGRKRNGGLSMAEKT